jgi:DNA repair exonuclease SbcCD nuclease subunit
MKLALCSDLHLEFGPISLENTEGADVLILSGDICIAKEVMDHDPYGLVPNTRSSMFHTFFQECSARFPHVIYIAGNHEHYHGDYAKSLPNLKERLAYLKNVHVLDKEVRAIGDVIFIGGTLWTDMNKEDPNTLFTIKGYMNDYKIIEDSSEVVHYKVYHDKMKSVGMTDEEWVALPPEERVYVEFKTRPAKFSPEKSVEDHKKMLEFIRTTIATNPFSKFVIVGHHAPCKMSTKPQYEKDVVVNGAYSSDLSEFILDHPQIKLWTHGHTHDVYDYLVGTTRVVCNPRGYIAYEDRADRFELKFLDV